MNGYISFHKDRQHEVYAETKAEAHAQSVKFFKAKKPWDVTTHLAETDVVDGVGKQVTTVLD